MQDEDTYKTLATASQGLFKSKGSKFLSFAYPILSEDQTTQIVHSLKKEYHDARHHCYAYALGINRELTRANDAGEPTNSAGKPILGQIVSFDLTQVLVVVVRYFGGTLLGVGGLIQAYKASANDALSKSEIIQKTLKVPFEIRCGYSELDAVKRILKEQNASIEEQNYDLHCILNVSIRQSLSKVFKGHFSGMKEVMVKELT